MNNPSFDPAITVAFTGHRPEKIFRRTFDPHLEKAIRNKALHAIDNLYRQGYRNFITGMARGFNLWAALTVIDMKASKDYPDMTLTCAIPFAEQRRYFDDDSQSQYDKIMDAADFHSILSPNYYTKCLLRRNDWMLERSSALICYFNGNSGGTAYTVTKARRAEFTIINLHETVIR